MSSRALEVVKLGLQAEEILKSSSYKSLQTRIAENRRANQGGAPGDLGSGSFHDRYAQSTRDTGHGHVRVSVYFWTMSQRDTATHGFPCLFVDECPVYLWTTIVREEWRYRFLF